MTVSKSQRGETCEGWNDCPPMIRSREVSSSNLGKRRAHRIGSNYSSRENSTNDLSTTLNVLPPVRKPSPSAIVPSVLSSQENINQLKSARDPVSLDKVELQFESFIQSPSKLSSKELDFYTNKIKKSLEILSLNDLQFLYQTLLAGNEIGTKQSIVEYMVLNDGVSSWCSPLKKLIDNVI